MAQTIFHCQKHTQSTHLYHPYMVESILACHTFVLTKFLTILTSMPLSILLCHSSILTILTLHAMPPSLPLFVTRTDAIIVKTGPKRGTGQYAIDPTQPDPAFDGLMTENALGPLCFHPPLRSLSSVSSSSCPRTPPVPWLAPRFKPALHFTAPREGTGAGHGLFLMCALLNSAQIWFTDTQNRLPGYRVQLLARGRVNST